MNEQSSAAAGDAAETTDRGGQPDATDVAEEQNRGGQSSTEVVREQKTDQHPVGEEHVDDDRSLGGTRLGDILGEITDLPTEVREKEQKAPKAKPETGDRKPDSKAKPSKAKPKAGEPSPEDEDESLDDEWLPSARAQIIDARQGRKKWRERAEKAEARAKELEGETGELKKRTAPIIAPTQADPLADITDEQNLVACAQDYQRLQQWAKRNRQGLADVVIGKDAEGKEVRHDYTPEEMAEIEIDCDRILNQAVPMRAAYIHDNRIFEAQAREVYPEIFDEKSESGKEASLILQQLPEIKRFTDWQFWLGDAIYRRNERVKAAQEAAEAAKNGNGAGKPSPTVEALRKPQPARVGSVPTVRSTAPGAKRGSGDDVEVETAEKQMIESGGDEIDIEKFVGATLGGGQARGAREPVSV